LFRRLDKYTTFVGSSFIIGALPHISMLRAAFGFFANVKPSLSAGQQIMSKQDFSNANPLLFLASKL